MLGGGFFKREGFYKVLLALGLEGLEVRTFSLMVRALDYNARIRRFESQCRQSIFVLSHSIWDDPGRF